MQDFNVTTIPTGCSDVNTLCTHIRPTLVGGEGERRERGRGLEEPPISCWHRAPRRVNPVLPMPTRNVLA